MKPTELTPIQQGIKNVGSQAALARALGVTPMAVCRWAKKDRIPPLRVAQFSKVTGVPKWCVAPELYSPHEN